MKKWGNKYLSAPTNTATAFRHQQKALQKTIYIYIQHQFQTFNLLLLYYRIWGITVILVKRRTKPTVCQKSLKSEYVFQLRIIPHICCYPHHHKNPLIHNSLNNIFHFFLLYVIYNFVYFTHIFYICELK